MAKSPSLADMPLDGMAPDEVDGDDGMGDEDDEAVEAAQAVLDAIADGDAAALSEALEAHYRCCKGG
jgi:DNA-binding GntR family transcriptional regulator